MSKTLVLSCTCKHEFQDKEYGNQKRLHNVSADGKKAYCTVCNESRRRNKATEDVTASPNNPFGMSYSIRKKTQLGVKNL